MPIQFLSEAEAEGMLYSVHGRAHPVQAALLQLRPGESILLPRKDWNQLTNGPQRLVNRLNGKGPLSYTCHMLADKSGWLIKRTDTFGNLPAKNYLATNQKPISMLQKQFPQRRYKFSDSTLQQITDEKLLYFAEDFAVLSAHGITQAELTDLAQRNEDFKNLRSEEQWNGIITDAAQERDAKADLCGIDCNRIRTAAEVKFGVSSGFYRSFDFDAINSQPHPERIRRYRLAGKRAAEVQAKLDSHGITIAFLADFATRVADYDAAEDTLREAESTSEAATIDRIDNGNSIYNSLDGLCTIAKNYWKDKDVAKYRNYVIYNTPSGTAEGESDTPEA